jgi:hypothetical protein
MAAQTGASPTAHGVAAVQRLATARATVAFIAASSATETS